MRLAKSLADPPCVFQAHPHSRRRKHYDRTGSLEDAEELSSQSFEELYSFYRDLIKPVTPQDIDSFYSSYRGSSEETRDLLHNYELFAGNMTQASCMQATAQALACHARAGGAAPGHNALGQALRLRLQARAGLPVADVLRPSAGLAPLLCSHQAALPGNWGTRAARLYQVGQARGQASHAQGAAEAAQHQRCRSLPAMSKPWWPPCSEPPCLCSALHRRCPCLAYDASYLHRPRAADNGTLRCPVTGLVVADRLQRLDCSSRTRPCRQPLMVAVFQAGVPNCRQMCSLCAAGHSSRARACRQSWSRLKPCDHLQADMQPVRCRSRAQQRGQSALAALEAKYCQPTAAKRRRAGAAQQWQPDLVGQAAQPAAVEPTAAGVPGGSQKPSRNLKKQQPEPPGADADGDAAPVLEFGEQPVPGRRKSSKKARAAAAAAAAAAEVSTVQATPPKTRKCRERTDA